MPLKFKDAVLVPVTVTGYQPYALGAAPTGYFGPAGAGYVTGDQWGYVVVDDPKAPTVREIGVGTYTAGGTPTVSRAVRRSTLGEGVAINWGASTSAWMYILPSGDDLIVLDPVSGMPSAKGSLLGDAGTTAGTASVQTVTLPLAPTAYVRGLRFTVTIGGGLTCTAGATLNINGLGAKTLVRPDGNAVQAGDLVAGRTYDCWYDGTSVVVFSLGSLTGSIIGSAYLQNNAFTALTAGYSAWPTSSVALGNTVGTQIFSLSYNVQSATSLLELSLNFQLFAYSGQALAEVVSIYRDGGATPVASAQFGIPAAQSSIVNKTVTIPAGAAGSTTFTARYARFLSDGTSVWLNGCYRSDLSTAGPVLGGTLGSEFRIKEIRQ